MGRGRSICMVAAMSMGLAGAACGSSPSESLCRRSAGAELCLVGDGDSYEIEGAGFASRSELVVVFDGGGDRPMVLTTADDGTASESATAGVMAGPVEQRLMVTGLAADGASATFDFLLSASR
jgi:hypothetical protein